MELLYRVMNHLFLVLTKSWILHLQLQTVLERRTYRSNMSILLTCHQRIDFWSNVKLMYADYAIFSLFLVCFLARSIALAWQPKGRMLSSGVNFSHSLYDFYPTGLYFLYKTRLPFYLLLHSIMKGKNPRIAQVVYLVPHVRSLFWIVFWGIMEK